MIGFEKLDSEDVNLTGKKYINNCEMLRPFNGNPQIIITEQKLIAEMASIDSYVCVVLDFFRVSNAAYRCNYVI